MAERELKKRKSTKLNRKEWVAGYLFLLPNLIGFLIFTAIPVVMGLVISLTDYSGFGKLNFIGIQNYIKMFHDSNFTIALKNNFFYTITTVPLTILFSLLLALMLNRKLYGGGFFKTIYFFPNLTSMVAVGCVWLQLFQVKNGPVNQLLMSFGVENPPKWFWGTSTAMISIVIVVVWKQAGYYMIMFLGGLKSIPSHLYESAKIDGATAFKTFRYITWPMLSPTTFMVTILTFIASFQVFDIINVTTEGGPGRETSVLVMRVYQEAFRYGKMGYASSIGYFLFLIVFLLTIIQWRAQKKWVNDDI
ncbi:multiple sugar transport system permease protein [Anaerocolumna jejuensis DSM 15929]|jgi:ABC-type sugar transport system permease subunit|uniref:Multiple sugar transport system permease protein n=1 Tax=Anaerocolumna jejuensis DSM 15929 TaxID=1121322 RepID=A0A1M6V922_9FIRM|nr:sugar ABC transporter permease [Anaerocolumna jejuensis]SHK78003.1 multiple sugar transport system permease protein [Anaerocolumna jejuensis DSM 15929]